MGEKCKISIRNIRRDANEELKKLLRSKEIGEDDEKSFEKNVQNITDKHRTMFPWLYMYYEVVNKLCKYKSHTVL